MQATWFFLSNLCFLLSFGWTIYAFRSGRFRPARFNLAIIAAGFVFQSLFLYGRGMETKSCPLTTLPDLLVFMAWSMVFIYLIVGPAYRLSLMGSFTAPLVLAMQIAAWPMWSRVPLLSPRSANAWVEFHGALSVVAYGAFGLAAVAGTMYLLQEWHLKRRRVSTLFYNLPPIENLALAVGRLLVFGFATLTVAFVAGLLAGRPVDGWKFGASICLWGLYGAVLLLRSRRRLAPHRLAACSIGVFVLVVVTLPAIHYLSSAAK